MVLSVWEGSLALGIESRVREYSLASHPHGFNRPAARLPDGFGREWLARDPPLAALDLLDHDPGDLAQVLALD
jgi:hypothetical protein